MARRIQALRPEGYSWEELSPLVELTLRNRISVLLRGHPGVGKSALALDVASRMGLPLIDIRLAQREPAELSGVHFPDRERNVLALFAPEWVERAVREPCFIFLDEINAAVTRLHQAAAYQIVLERRVGPHQLHAGTVVMAAGNLEEDNAIVTTLSSALCNRFAHFTLRVDVDAWLRWAEIRGIHGGIRGHIARHGEDILYSNDGEYALPTHRSWEMASRLLSSAPDEVLGKRSVAACVGPAAAEKLFSFLRIYRRVNAARIVRKGHAMDFTRGKQSEPSFVYATMFSVAAWLVHECPGLGDAELSNIVAFLRSRGLEPEYVFLFLRQIKQRSELLARLRGVPAYRELARELVDLRVGLYQ